MELTERDQSAESSSELTAYGVMPRLRVVKEPPPKEEEPARFAVLRGERRVAWGLRDRAAAQRWLRRLNAPVQVPLTLGA
jgi:hypothetical protein